MQELEMIKAFAKLDGVKIKEDKHHGFIVDNSDSKIFFPFKESYNPIIDLALNCEARDKYGVEIDYTYDSACLCGKSFSYFEGKKDVPRAVIEVILKSKGKWVE